LILQGRRKKEERFKRDKDKIPAANLMMPGRLSDIGTLAATVAP